MGSEVSPSIFNKCQSNGIPGAVTYLLLQYVLQPLGFLRQTISTHFFNEIVEDFKHFIVVFEIFVETFFDPALEQIEHSANAKLDIS